MTEAVPVLPIRTDIYQDQKCCAVQHVVLDIRGHTVEDIRPDPNNQSLTLEITIDSEQYVKAWAFYAPFEPAGLKIDRGRVKIEIVLAKEVAVSWPRVEADEGATIALYERWNKASLPKEEDDKAEGVDHFLQKIWKDASTEAQPAMMKNITESQGTVLSTNWEDVGARHVTPQPPKD
jgi:suppressor of G2 allele of SKP1